MALLENLNTDTVSKVAKAGQLFSWAQLNKLLPFGMLAVWEMGQM